MTVVSELAVVMGADISGLTRGLTQADGMLESFAGSSAQRFEQLGKKIQGIGANLTALTAPFAIFGAKGVQTASTFESLMAEIGARTGATADEMQRISTFALKMGADTAFSAQEAGDAFLQLLTSGSSVEESMHLLPSVLDAAAASGADLGQTADLLTDIMASMGIDVEYAGDVVNDLARAAGASSADMMSLGQGFANVGNVASNFGISMRDTAAILAVLSENGIKGAEAGTALRSMLMNMTRPTEAVQGAWNELGLSFYDAQGNTRDIATVIGELDTALDHLPIEEQNRLMYELAGSYGIAALSALRGSISIEDMVGAMMTAADASDVADARMATFAGAMDALGGSVETLMIRAFTPFMQNSLQPMVELATRAINVVADFAAANPVLTESLIQIGAALAIVGPSMLAIGTAMAAIGPLAAALGLSVGALVGGFGAIAVVGLGAAYAFNKLRQSNGPLMQELRQMGRQMGRIIGYAVDVGAAFTRIGRVILSGLFPQFTLLRDSGNFVVGIFERLTDRLGVAQRWMMIGADAAALLATYIEAIAQPKIDVSAMQGIMATLQSLAQNPLIRALLGDDLTATDVGVAFGQIRDHILGTIAAVDDFDFKDMAKGIGERIAGALENLTDLDFSGVGTMISTTLANVKVTAAGLASRIKTALEGLMPASFAFSLPNVDVSGVASDIETALGNVTFSFPTTVQNLARALDDHVSLAVGAAALLIGGPLGLGISLARLVAAAIETDFLGVDTWLRQSEIGMAVATAFENVRLEIERIAAGIFGGGPRRLAVGAAGTEAAAGDGSVLGFVAQFFEGLSTIQLPDLTPLITAIERVATPLINAVRTVATEDLGPGITDLGFGLRVFFDNLANADTTGYARLGPALEAVAVGVSTLVGGLIEVGGELAGGLLSSLGANLPAIGTGIASLVTAGSQLLEGDAAGALSSLGDGLTAIGEGVGKIALDALNGVINALERLTNLELPSYEDISATKLLLEALAVFQRDGGGALFGLPLDFGTMEPGRGATGEGSRGFEKPMVELDLDPKLKSIETFRSALLAEIGIANEEAYQTSPKIETWLTQVGLSLRTQVEQFIKDAVSTPFFATALLDLRLLPGRIDITAIAASIQAKLNSLAPSPGSLGGGGPMVPMAANGAYVMADGIAYLHAGERVLNPSETRAYERGGGTTNVFHVYGEAPYEVARMVDKANQRSGARYG